MIENKQFNNCSNTILFTKPTDAKNNYCEKDEPSPCSQKLNDVNITYLGSYLLITAPVLSMECLECVAPQPYCSLLAL